MMPKFPIDKHIYFMVRHVTVPHFRKILLQSCMTFEDLSYKISRLWYEWC